MSRGTATDEFRDSFQLHSVDGTPLRVWVGGDGPPIVLVHGSFADHRAWAVPVAELNKHFTTFAMDRRGFGGSGDGAEYSIERDFHDVSAVVRAASVRSDQPVILWGHSYGANCAMGGASISSDTDHLVLYEPSLGLKYPPGAIEEAEAALAAGDREKAVVRMLFDILDMSQDEIDALRSSPRWPHLLAGAHTAPRECRTEEAWEYGAGQFDGIGAPTLLLSGSESPASVKEATERAAGDTKYPHPRIGRSWPFRSPNRPCDGRLDHPRTLVAIANGLQRLTHTRVGVCPPALEVPIEAPLEVLVIHPELSIQDGRHIRY
jgi:pimeloyl-ACP methyl ester carboxylesterase